MGYDISLTEMDPPDEWGQTWVLIFNPVNDAPPIAVPLTDEDLMHVREVVGQSLAG